MNALQFQFCMLKERYKQFLLTTGMPQRTAYRSAQLLHILRNIICKVSILSPIPDLFNRIKFRRISRKPFKTDSFGKSLMQSSLRPSMDQPTIENQDNTLAKAFQKLCNKFLKIIHPNIAILNREVQTQSMMSGRNADCGNSRQPISSVPAIFDRCFTFRSPGATNDWLKHKTAFINQYNGSAASAGFFLYGASPACAIALWPVRPALLPAVRVSDNSSPSLAADARSLKGRSIPRTAGAPLEPLGLMSINRWQNRVPLGLSAAKPQVFCADGRSIWVLGRDAAWPSDRRDHLAGGVFSIALSRLWKRRGCRQLRRDDNLFEAVRWLETPAVRVLGGFHLFSSTLYRHVSCNLFNSSKFNQF